MVRAAECCCALFSLGVLNLCTGYGGAISVYFGLSVGLQLLDVSFFNLVLQSNVFTNCLVSSNPSFGGNVYGGAVSLYVGGYSSFRSQNGAAMAAVGDTVVRNVNVNLNTAQFTSCSAMSSHNGSRPRGANAYGGSFSFYIGAYAWSSSVAASSSSACGTTTASVVNISVSNASSSNCRAVTTASGGSASLGANSYGGSMSVWYVGAYAWSNSNAASSNSTCETSTASAVSISISNTPSSNCSAVTATGAGGSYGANSYGGSMSVVYVGAYAWSFSNATSTSSACGATNASAVSISISNAHSYNCSAVTTTSGSFGSNGANSYGGSMSVVYVGAYAWSSSFASSSSSTCGTTTASGVRVNISNAPAYNCSAVTATVGGQSSGANSYGGSMSVVYVGANAWNLNIGSLFSNSASFCDLTRTTELFILMNASTFSDSLSLSRKLCCLIETAVQISSSILEPQKPQVADL
jgi:hypothetical protein